MSTYSLTSAMPSGFATSRRLGTSGAIVCGVRGGAVEGSSPSRFGDLPRRSRLGALSGFKCPGLKLDRAGKGSNLGIRLARSEELSAPLFLGRSPPSLDSKSRAVGGELGRDRARSCGGRSTRGCSYAFPVTNSDENTGVAFHNFALRCSFRAFGSTPPDFEALFCIRNGDPSLLSRQRTTTKPKEQHLY